MKALFVKYKLVIRFIATFLAVYISLTMFYKFYLQFSDGSIFYPDYITFMVAKQSRALIESLGYQVQVMAHPNEASIKLIINGNYLARVIEGCNSVSVIILFVSFVVAFANKFKITFLFLFAGSVLIYAVNLIRIAILSIGLFHFPNQQDVFHTVFFPAIIYGLVFLLWVIWVRKFTKV